MSISVSQVGALNIVGTPGTSHPAGAITSVAAHETTCYGWMNRTDSTTVLTSVADAGGAYTEVGSLSGSPVVASSMWDKQDVAANASRTPTGTSDGNVNSQNAAIRLTSSLGGVNYPIRHVTGVSNRSEIVDGTPGTAHQSSAITVTAPTGLVLGLFAGSSANTSTPTATITRTGDSPSAATVAPAGGAGTRLFWVYANFSQAGEYTLDLTGVSTVGAFHLAAYTDETIVLPPTVTSISGDNTVLQNEAPVIVGTDFDTATVTFEQTGGVSVSQSIGTQSATSIDLSGVTGFATGEALKNGSFTARVTNGDAQSDTVNGTLSPPSDVAYVNLSTAAASGQKITAIPSLASGDQVEWRNVTGSGSFSIIDVTIYDDHTASWQNGVTQWELRAYDNVAKEWSEWVVQLVEEIGQVTTIDPIPAGGSRSRKGQRRQQRYFVEIDGQEFVVDTAQQAQALLERARALAEREAEKAADETVSRLAQKKRIPEVRIDAPEISLSPEIAEDFAPLIADIKRLYEKAAVNAELRLRLERMLADEEEGELLLLL